MACDAPMTVAETALFIRQVAKLWTEDDRTAFVDFIATNRTPATSLPIPAASERSAGIGLGRKARWRSRHLLLPGRSDAAISAADLRQNLAGELDT
jgi:hypothetical protein